MEIYYPLLAVLCCFVVILACVFLIIGIIHLIIDLIDELKERKKWKH